MGDTSPEGVCWLGQQLLPGSTTPVSESSQIELSGYCYPTPERIQLRGGRDLAKRVAEWCRPQKEVPHRPPALQMPQSIRIRIDATALEHVDPRRTVQAMVVLGDETTLVGRASLAPEVAGEAARVYWGITSVRHVESIREQTVVQAQQMREPLTKVRLDR